MKFTWLSNAPWAATGYGNQTALFLPLFKEAGHDPAVIAFYGLEGTPINWNGIQVYGKGLGPWGLDVADAHTNHFGARVCFSLVDAWVLEPSAFPSGAKWIPWFPVDMDPLPPPVAAKIRGAYRRIVFSKHAQRSVEAAGMDCYYVPHGVDTEQYRPVDRREAREKLGWPQDRFVVGMVAANKGNPSRKALIQHIEAFAHFHKKYPDTALYLHTTRGEHGEMDGVNLLEWVELFGLSHTTLGRPDMNTDAAVWFCDQYVAILGFPTNYMQHAYSGMDVHALVSMGEGFGIPTLEAQACGTPVIVGGWTAMPELCFSGEIVDVKHAERFPTPMGAFQYLPRPDSIAIAMERAYRKPGSPEKARAGAMQYDARRVMRDYWTPVLAEIEQDVALWEGAVR